MWYVRSSGVSRVEHVSWAPLEGGGGRGAPLNIFATRLTLLTV